ncbi:MAG: ribosomal protein S18-alanine N-acetyltransferase [Nocardioides sp.]
MTPVATNVRVAGPEDVAAVARLERDCLGEDAWSEGLVGEGIRGALPTVSYLVAETGGAVIGHAVISATGDIAELQRIAVDPGRRRQSVASALLAGVIEAAGRTEADRLLLEVREDNRAALAFYARAGFVEIDRRPRYYADGSTAVVMRLGIGRGCGSGG